MTWDRAVAFTSKKNVNKYSASYSTKYRFVASGKTPKFEIKANWTSCFSDLWSFYG